MDIEAALRIASDHFVLHERRDRFIHEAKKKPAKLMARVCHDIESLFDERFQNEICAYRQSDRCMLFKLTGRMEVTTWREAMETAQRGGGGILIIDESGKRFYAESEGFPAPKQYAGNA
jgi:hypothetical protein